MKKILILIPTMSLAFNTLLFAQESRANDPSFLTTSVSSSDTGTKNDAKMQQERKKFNQTTKEKNRIYEVPLRNDVVFKLQTALGYVSTIELPEPALKVFVGDQNLFKVGVYDKEVLVKPITEFEDARTNLQITTENHRLSFDVSVGPGETADFILDFKQAGEDVIAENLIQKKVDEKTREKEDALDARQKNLEEEAKTLAKAKFKEEILKGGESIPLKEHSELGDVRANLISLSRIGDKAYLKFGLRNLSSSPYKISRVVLGYETYEKTKLGFGKESKGVSEIDSELDIKNPVASSDYVYGVLSFDLKALDKHQKPVFLVFEEDGKRNFRISGFKWVGENN
ncbi:MAG: TrbG/VirB9 family P-type conjugative transfer protein [Candidatus Omnitrophica bacterium]|nr:TrbG/VirB9 family P-type conjugative transfer protein [Candidatus Omnitrophota bacterium]